MAGFLSGITGSIGSTVKYWEETTVVQLYSYIITMQILVGFS